MKISPQLVVDYARELQGLDFPAERAPKIARELDRLAAGALGIGGAALGSGDPTNFLAVLHELADAADVQNE